MEKNGGIGVLGRHPAGFGLLNAAVVGAGPVLLFLIAIANRSLSFVYVLVTFIILIVGVTIAGILMRYPEHGRPFAVVAWWFIGIHAIAGLFGFYILNGAES